MRERIVFICGAGFSKVAQAPLVDEFLQRAREIYSNDRHKLNASEQNHFKKVFDYHKTLGRAKTKINFDIDNIEELFSLLDINITVNDNAELKETREALIYLIIRTLDILIKPEKCTVYNTFMKKLYHTENQFSFITFNYDLIIENALRNGDCRYIYCTDPTEKEIKPGHLKLLKLHGSASWLTCHRCNSFKDIGHKAIRNHYELKCMKCGEKIVPLLVPPTWNKRLDISYIRNVWHTALMELQKATKIVIIGYSLPKTDMYFRDFLALSLRDNDYLRDIIVVDIKDEIKAHYESFFESNFSRRHFRFMKRSFGDDLAQNL